MKKLIQTGVLAFVAVLALASTARAEAFPVGFVVWQQQECEQGPAAVALVCGQFSISNQTGANNQVAFPILDFVSFSGMTLTIDGATVNTVPGDFVDQNSPEPGYNFDLSYFGAAPFSGVIGGGPAPTGPFNLDGGGQVNLVGGFYSVPTNLFDDEFDQAIIYVDGNRVPEPVTLSLLGLGLAGAAIRRRRAGRN